MHVYRITNLVTGKSYVGFSKDANNRFKRQICLAEQGVNRRLYDSIRKHSKENFVLTILDTCNTREEAVTLEKHWIAELNTLMPNGYNMTTGGDGGNTLSSWSEEDRKSLYKRQGESRKGTVVSEETRRKISISNKGKVIPMSIRLHLSSIMKGRKRGPQRKRSKPSWIKGKTHSVATRLKISKARLGKSWEDIWESDYIKQRKDILRERFLAENNPRYVVFTLKDKLGILSTISRDVNLKMADISRSCGFSEFKVRELLREVGIGKFNTVKKENKMNWSGYISNVSSALFKEGQDVTELLGIQLYEAPIPACLAGLVRGNFPVGIPKTEATRIQNLSKEFWEDLKTHEVEITEKIHGSSCTMFLDIDGEFHVCSRNLDLKPDENNSFWKIAYKYDVENKLRFEDWFGLAIQGELIGEGINGNQYKVGLEFLVFNIYDTCKKKYLTYSQRLFICEVLGLKHVPVLYTGVIHKDNTVQDTLKLAEGKSELNGSNREGFVIKSQKDTGIIVKVISNAWLLKNED